MAKAQAHIPESLESLLRSEWTAVIEEACLGAEDEYIAKRYLLDAIPQIEIAAEVEEVFDRPFHRSTISARLPKMFAKIERTARKMGKI